MTFSRSTLRHACFRAKKGTASPENKRVLEVIEPLLAPHQKWSNFSTEWDIVLDKAHQIFVIKPESDYDYVHSTCLEISFLAKKQAGFDSLDMRAQNVKTCVESTMLENIMLWENYNSAWGVSIDAELKFIRTMMYKVDPNQLTVTAEMIEASKGDKSGLKIEMAPVPVEMILRPMSDEHRQQFEQFLSQTVNPKE